jgi:glycerol-3-phosphate acyltransferase PlsY
MLSENYFGSGFLLICAYLIGSLPNAFLVVYFVTVSSTMEIGKVTGAYSVKKTIGLIPSIFVFSMDLLKGFLPTIAATYLIPGEVTITLALALLLVVGHNWSIFLNFAGGRGIAIALGTLLGLHLWQETVILVVLFGLIGKHILYKDSALWSCLGIALLPVLLLFLDRGLGFTIFGICLGSILFTKRLLADEKILDLRYIDWRVLLSRLVWDRDIMSRER